MSNLLLPVTLDIRFPDLLGHRLVDMAEQERRNRWAQWLRLARAGTSSALANYWTNSTACAGCIHLRGSWCSSSELPCTVNPYLTFRHGVIGMACMGAGYESLVPSTAVASTDC